MSSHSAIAESGEVGKGREMSERPRLSNSSVEGPPPEKNNDDGEVFHDVEGGVSYRTLGWIRASVIFMKGKNHIRNRLIGPTPNDFLQSNSPLVCLESQSHSTHSVCICTTIRNHLVSNSNIPIRRCRRQSVRHWLGPSQLL